MQRWSVFVEVAGELDEVHAEGVLELLAQHAGALSLGEGHWSATVDVAAPSAEEAATRGVRIVTDPRGVSPLAVVRVHVDTVELQESDLAKPTFPALLGVAELAKHLGVTTQRVAQLTQRDDFPEPIVRLAAGPVWLASSIDAFVETWDRKPGRPSKPLQDLEAGLSRSLEMARAATKQVEATGEEVRRATAAVEHDLELDVEGQKYFVHVKHGAGPSQDLQIDTFLAAGTGAVAATLVSSLILEWLKKQRMNKAKPAAAKLTLIKGAQSGKLTRHLARGMKSA